MSATEIIGEIRKLPLPEQEKVLDFLQNQREQAESGKKQVRYATDPDFDKAADKVLRDHADLFRRLAQ
jgi:DNA-binding NtrC family response regulator